jgi:3-hydroxymyristoyl/3-hydroxydecanoyl-(acyl carrier protein) dehydratase
MSGDGFQQALCIEASHPALPGHFPGQPLVPGVVLLEQVAVALRAWRGQRLAQVVEAKFMAPLLPDDTALLRLSEASATGTRIRFEIERDGTVLARGVVEGAT